MIVEIEDFKVLQKCIKEYKAICGIIGNILDAPSKGGNVSVKDGDYLIIKSSGENLKEDHKISILYGGINKYSFYRDDFCLRVTKPSMEVGMHLVFKNKYVAHYHPAYVLPYLCSKDYVFKDKFNVVEFALPGNDLCRQLTNHYKYEEKGVLMLRNHGVVLYSEKIEDLLYLYKEVKSEFFEKSNFLYTPDDVVDSESFELWLFRNSIENIASKKGLDLTTLSQSVIKELLNLPDEKYRKNKIESDKA